MVMGGRAYLAGRKAVCAGEWERKAGRQPARESKLLIFRFGQAKESAMKAVVFHGIGDIRLEDVR